jgi:hypothetical protein
MFHASFENQRFYIDSLNMEIMDFWVAKDFPKSIKTVGIYLDFQKNFPEECKWQSQGICPIFGQIHNDFDILWYLHTEKRKNNYGMVAKFKLINRAVVNHRQLALSENLVTLKKSIVHHYVQITDSLSLLTIWWNMFWGIPHFQTAASSSPPEPSPPGPRETHWARRPWR